MLQTSVWPLLIAAQREAEAGIFTDRHEYHVTEIASFCLHICLAVCCRIVSKSLREWIKSRIRVFTRPELCSCLHFVCMADFVPLFRFFVGIHQSLQTLTVLVAMVGEHSST